MYEIVIVDDEEIFLNQVHEKVNQIMTDIGLVPDIDFHIAGYQDPDEFKEALLSEEDSCHLLLMDVEFKDREQNGLDLARELREEGIDCSLVFMTFHRDYVFDSFEMKPLWYLLKPLDWDKLKDIIMTDYEESYCSTVLDLKIGRDLLSLPFKSIIAMEAVSHHVRVWMDDQRSLEWNGTLSKLEQELSGWYFCKCHNSYLINLTQVSELLKTEVKMKNGLSFPVSRRYYPSALKQYFSLLKK